MIYLDSNATGFPHPGMIAYLCDLFSGKNFGNPSSTHFYGRSSKILISESVEIIKSFFGMSKDVTVVFTSGATEALNLMIRSLPKGHVISSSIEHISVIEPLKLLPNPVSYLDPKEDCVVNLKQIERAVRSDTVAIVLGWANGETGVKIDLPAIANFAKEHGLILLVDAVAVVCKEEVIVPEGVSGISFSGHKIHALPGVGCAVLSPSFKLKPLIVGGGQQNGYRSGTENLWGIVSLGYILRHIRPEVHEVGGKMAFLRNFLEDQVILTIPDIKIHCCKVERVTNVSSIAFLGVEGEILQAALDLEGLAVSYGSACSSGAQAISHALIGSGILEEDAVATVRFSLSRFTTQADIELAIPIIDKVVRRLRGIP